MRNYLFILLIVVCFNTYGQTYQGKVIRIADGDTITILVDKQQLKIRLAEIDTPERKQPYGKKAKEALSDLIAGKMVRVEKETIDRYKRIVGRVYDGDLYINAEMVRQGHAWVYRKYSKSVELLQLEQEAKEAKLGLWALPEVERVPPWEWRRKK